MKRIFTALIDITVVTMKEADRTSRPDMDSTDTGGAYERLRPGPATQGFLHLSPRFLCAQDPGTFHFKAPPYPELFCSLDACHVSSLQEVGGIPSNLPPHPGFCVGASSTGELACVDHPGQGQP